MASRCIFSCAHRTRGDIRCATCGSRSAAGQTPRDRFRHLLYFATCTHDRVYLINAQYDCFQITIEGEPFVRAQLDAGQWRVSAGRAHGQFRNDAQCRAAPARAARVDGHVRAQCAQDQRRSRLPINPADEPDIISLGEIDAMLQIAERLDRGTFVGMLGDRTLGEEPAHPVRMLGESAYLPMGPMRAAGDAAPSGDFHAGSVPRRSNHYHVVFAPLADFSATPGRRARRGGVRCRSSATPRCSITIAAAIRTIGSIFSTSGANADTGAAA